MWTLQTESMGIYNKYTTNIQQFVFKGNMASTLMDRIKIMEVEDENLTICFSVQPYRGGGKAMIRIKK